MSRTRKKHRPIIIVLGNQYANDTNSRIKGVGKTSIIRNMMNVTAPQTYAPTKTIKRYPIRDNRSGLKFELRDSTNENFNDFNDILCSVATFFVIVFDITNKNSFKNVFKYVKLIRSFYKPDDRIVIIANKTDLPKNTWIVDELALQEHTLKFFFNSCYDQELSTSKKILKYIVRRIQPPKISQIEQKDVNKDNNC